MIGMWLMVVWIEGIVVVFLVNMFIFLIEVEIL